MGKCQDCGCNHQVVIYKEGCSYRVEPGRLVVHPRATVTFVLHLPPDGGVALWFPQGTTNAEPIPFKKGQKSVPIDVGKKTGVFAYAVHVPGGAHRSDFAEGGSPPRMIVADP